MSAHTPGPVETLARLAIQSERYVQDEEFRLAVDAVIGRPFYDAAPALLSALYDMVEDGDAIDKLKALAAIAKA
jgi:hypothetical protein